MVKKWIFSLFVFLLVGEVVIRAYWSWDRKVPFWSDSTVYYGFHPQMFSTGVEQVPIQRGGEQFQILILGGSVAAGAFGKGTESIEKRYAEIVGRPVKIYNLAYPAHNSRDSLIKYRRLSKQRFDRVLIYDCINDVRMNNCPPAMFREDYSHSVWYRHLALADEMPGLALFTFPFQSLELWGRIGHGLGWYIPSTRFTPEWSRFGQTISTERSFRANMEAILEMARVRGDRIVLMTFAHYFPENYTLEAFRAKSLDFGQHLSPTELWGEPENVKRGIEAHNHILPSLVGAYPESQFRDFANRVPGGREFFDDCCHLTDRGSNLLIEELGSVLRDYPP